MTNPETESGRTDREALTNAESTESRNLELTQVSPGLEIVFADGCERKLDRRNRRRGSPNPEVMIVSPGNPVSDEALKAPWFGVFEVRRAKSFPEIRAQLSKALPRSCCPLHLSAWLSCSFRADDRMLTPRRDGRSLLR